MKVSVRAGNCRNSEISFSLGQPAMHAAPSQSVNNIGNLLNVGGVVQNQQCCCQEICFAAACLIK